MCPDFPKIGGATAAEVAAAILVDPGTDKIDGSQVDAAVSSRASTAALATVDTDVLTRAPAGEYDTKLDATVSSRAAAADYTANRAAKIDKIQDFLEEGSGTLTADGLLQTVREYVGVGKLHAYIDLTALGPSDTVVISQLMKIKTSYIKYAEETYSAVQTLPLLHIAMKPGKLGVKITLQQTAKNGGYKSFDWETLVETAAT